jgi:hypothetical protein
VTTTVLGEIKIVGLLILSALILDEGKEFTPKMLLGCLLAMAGFLMYSQTKIEKIRMSSSSGGGERGVLPSISREASSSSFGEREPLKQ